MSFDFGPIMDANISVYTVGFVLLDGSIPMPLGSGTLVRCRTIQGILTCGHVLAKLPVSDDFGVAQFGLPDKRDQRIGFLSGALGKRLGVEVATKKGDDGERRYYITS